jgi:hypothetical protein
MFKVIIPHRDAVFDGLIFPHEPCASDRSRVCRFALLPPSGSSPGRSSRRTVSGFRPP